MLSTTDLTFSITNRQIALILNQKQADGLQQDNKKITGTVLDEAGETVIGANIKEKGTTNGTITDVDGNFSLNVADNATLQISYIGYTTQEIAVGSQTRLQIALREDVLGLDEVIVIGYGTARRQDYIGSVSSVKMENSALATIPNLNVLESLKGSVSGLSIGATTSAGGEPDMLIRGQNSINGSNNPLIILDGVIFMGSLSDINPNDIASIDVLKDAVSAAAYGSRSANGIIAVNTKKGRSEKPVVSFSTSAGIQTYPNKVDLLRGEDWLIKANTIMGNPLDDTSFLSMYAEVLENLQNGKETYWVDEVTRTGSLQDYQIAVSGAAKGLNYYVSTSYEKNIGVVVGDDFNRISILGKINADVTKWLNIGVDAAFSRRDYSGTAAAFGSIMSGLIPYALNYRDDQGNLEVWPMDSGGRHPLWDAKSGTRDNTDYRYNFRLNTYAVVSLPWVKGLSYRLNFLPNLDQERQGDFYHEDYYIRSGQGPERYTPAAIQLLLPQANGALTQKQTYSYVLDHILTYKNTFGKHNVEATLVATRDYSKYEQSKMTGSDFANIGNTVLGIDGLHNATIQKIDLTGGTKRTNIGYLARASYGFDSKYRIDASIRRDGASVFGADRKWGNFASAGASWIISKESFMESFEPLNNLKLKVLWGQNGNQGIDPYTTLSSVNTGSSGGIRYEFSNTGSQIYYGLNQSRLGNSSLGWESTEAWNFGFESAWLKNRLFLDLDFYHTKTYDQLFNRTIPSMTGFSSMYTSMGQVNNTGVEINLRSVNIENKDLTWMTSLIFHKNNNKVIHLYGEDADGDGKEDDDIGNSLFIGKSLGAIYGYKQIGIVQEDDTEYIALTSASPGNPKYEDLDGVPGISAEDRTILGYSKENFRMSLANTLRYKGVELYVLVSGIFGGNNYLMKSNPYAFRHTGTHWIETYEMFERPSWTPENRNNTYPIAKFESDGRFQGLQSRGFVKIQDISLSYSFKSAAWLKSLNVQSLKVYLAAKNVATFTNWFGGDPESGARYLDNTFPVASTYSIGLNLSF
jgi:TonB-linked SusC/RagA family outer membrane protein